MGFFFQGQSLSYPDGLIYIVHRILMYFICYLYFLQEFNSSLPFQELILPKQKHLAQHFGETRMKEEKIKLVTVEDLEGQYPSIHIAIQTGQ